MNKELEESIIIFKELEIEDDKEFIKARETILKALENSISKEVIKEKKQKLEKEYKECLEENSTKAFILKCQLEILEELVEGK